MNFCISVVILAFLVNENLASNLPRDEVLCITPESDKEVEIVRNVTNSYQTVLWHPESVQHIQQNKEVHLYVNGSDVNKVKDLLNNAKIHNEVQIDDVQELIAKQIYNISNHPRDIAGSRSHYENYHPLEEIFSWMSEITGKNPHLLQQILIGSSSEKRPLYVLKLSVKGVTPKAAIWIDCGIHAREWISPAFCQWFLGYAVEHYQSDPDLSAILNKLEFYVLPVMNVDGYEYTRTTDRMWRKNRSQHEGNFCKGTDLNRNFDAGWCGAGASSDPCAQTYCGPFPESEPEVRAVADFIRKNKESIKGYISIHSYSQMVLFPYSYKTERAKDHRELMVLAKKASDAIRVGYQNKFGFGPGAETIYLAPGGSDDWAYDLGIKYSFTLELQDRGRYGFLLPPYLIRAACLEAYLTVKIIALHIVEKTE
ncbi:carboxypeptidase B2 [Latimeria chalumnae]|uniref:carboxypeptidase B2 n=1 Tax=Latimeria chalumnae TaxID=7897 RepID=UPI00313D1570